ncbi:MAG: cytochrome d ubiquinol oxidase subunit II [Candidatus Omnitrophica bacterium]|nr:cytochrome d ubiquinol oxidase subunit II [Candidatus Omnitrophota bacterium]
MDLNLIWFILFMVLISGYAILDGFDLGVGVLSLFAKGDEEKRIHMNAIGPVWDGNEVWLLTAGGSLFAAFPPVYATVFSSFYLAFMLLLVALIFRAVSLEFRSKVEDPRWRKSWDWAFGLGSFVPALLYGVTVGNIVQGLPLTKDWVFTGNFLGLLNPYALLVGLLSLVMFILHGSLYMGMKTEGDLQARMKSWASRTWIVFIVLYLITMIATLFAAKHALAALLGRPLFYLMFLVWCPALVLIPVFSQAGRFGKAFVASCVNIVGVIVMCAVAMFPRMVPASTDLAYSLTIYNASSTPRTLMVMLIIAGIGMPLVIAYTAFIYVVFKGKVVLTEESY